MGDVVCCVFGRRGFDRATEGILGAGQQLAAALGVRTVVVVLGPAEDALVAEAAARADAVHVAEHPLLLDEDHPELGLDALACVCTGLGPAAVLLGDDLRSQELTPRLAHRLGGSAAGDAAGLSALGGEVHVSRVVYGGKAQAVIALKRMPAVVWLRARAIAPAERRPGAAATVSPWPLSLEPSERERVRVVSRHAEPREAARLEDARMIVSGGRGLGGSEPFAQLRALADVLGAQVAASRAACDAGWVPPSWQVGQTGKKVAPDLYLAIALSGASQHLMGIADAKTIAAINIDPHAPIFKHCRFGLVEDYRKVVGPLRDRLAALLT
jgi:electron transfer flavoprotein alpha subunit